ncbi:hypothetical protein [Paracoccus sp. Ld10]|uniref:hypothetical protein n=1 Tax=Paracoccus sp. Ld10 TaxID=649158 RepID=UPI00386864C3
MAGLSLSQAAKATGRSKSTIGRAIQSGRLSALRNGDDTFSIDPSELFRAFPKGGPGTDRDAHNETVRTPQSGTAGASNERDQIESLRDELAKAQQRAAVAEAQAEERARALNAAERNLMDLRRMLPSPEKSQLAEDSVSFWHRFIKR